MGGKWRRQIKIRNYVLIPYMLNYHLFQKSMVIRSEFNNIIYILTKIIIHVNKWSKLGDRCHVSPTPRQLLGQTRACWKKKKKLNKIKKP
jgi:hypothetical protein